MHVRSRSPGSTHWTTSPTDYRTKLDSILAEVEHLPGCEVMKSREAQSHPPSGTLQFRPIRAEMGVLSLSISAEGGKGKPPKPQPLQCTPVPAGLCTCQSQYYNTTLLSVFFLVHHVQSGGLEGGGREQKLNLDSVTKIGPPESRVYLQASPIYLPRYITQMEHAI